ncbi:Uncharacterised protein [Mycobacteroides abscessus subsp. massiliense]|nr:Uncharacterised protein [Mycobacteroides abscessus subsp. massiliense]
MRTTGRLSPTNATPALASAAMTLARSRRPTSNCLPGSDRATMRTLTRSTSMLSTPISDGASSSSCDRSRSTSACWQTSYNTSLTRARSTLVGTGISTTARAQSFDKLTALTINPFGMVMTSPSLERNLVTRRVTSSTVPRDSVVCPCT